MAGKRPSTTAGPARVKARERSGSARRAPAPATIDRLTALCLLGILAAGCVTVYSASSQHGLAEGAHSGAYFLSHLKRVAIGLVVCLAAMKVDYRIWKRAAMPAACIAVLLLGLALRSDPVNGASRWVDLGFVRFQPAEPAKFALVFYLAARLSEVQDFRRELGRLLPVMILVGLGALILLLQPNFSMLLILGAVTAALLLLAGFPLLWYGALAVSLALPTALLMLAKSYRWERVMEWLASWTSMETSSEQVMQSYIGFGRGGILGQGLGGSMQKLFYLPEPFNDFILSIFGEEWGLRGGLLLLALYAVVFLRGMRIVRRSRDDFARLLAAGITILFLTQALVNMMATTGLIPVTGQPLPLFSYGGTALVTMLGALGVLLNISYQSRNLDPWR